MDKFLFEMNNAGPGEAEWTACFKMEPWIAVLGEYHDSPSKAIVEAAVKVLEEK